ncbi:MAG: HlyD family efflux transporter periplasmic adaptor subunit [Anaerolineae bacterium]|nr:HlyD family efflux transporter periplasmic adaptor subunit [Anaerolineae bacterium]
MKHISKLGILLILASSLLACAPVSQNPGATTVPVVQAGQDHTVIAEGFLHASEKRVLSFQTAGFIEEILVEEGDVVKAGDLLATLDPADAQLAVRQAETALQQTEAQLARLLAGPRETDLAVLQAQALSVQAVISQTVAQRNQLFSGVTEAQIAAAEANVAAALAQRVVALKQHDETMKCYDIPGSDEKVCPALGDPEEQARYALYAAEQALTAAEAQLVSLKPAAQAQIHTANTGITVAETQRALAEAQIEQLKAGASQDEIAAMQASVEQAQVALDMAQLALDRTMLYAPFTGQITAVNVDPGNPVAFGQGILFISEVENLQVRTLDLTEFNVVELSIGQTVVVIMDALPDVVLSGTITEISLEAADYRGDVVYPVTISLEEADPRLRLGMTAEVHIRTQ